MIGGLNITKLYENRLTLIIEDDIEEDIEFADEVIVEGNLVVKGNVGSIIEMRILVHSQADKTLIFRRA